MTQRFYIYPLLMLAGLNLLPLLRRDVRWHAAQIVQWALVVLAALGAIYFDENFIWVRIAWTLFMAFRVVPSVLLRVAAFLARAGRWNLAARAERWAGRLLWGQLGRMYRTHAAAFDLQFHGATDEALSLLDGLATRELPDAARGAARLWKLSLLAATRRWPEAVAYYETTDDWGALATATAARLAAARAYAETGQSERALRCLQFVVLSPRPPAGLRAQLWTTRVTVAALAGDAAGLEELLCERARPRLRRAARFAAYARGRCALARGEREQALEQLTQALTLTPAGDRLWRDAIAELLQRVDAAHPPTFAAQTEAYTHGVEMLRHAEAQAVRWRDLMSWGRPGAATLVLLAPMVGVYVLDCTLGPSAENSRLQLLLGNVPSEVWLGQWWRLVTALFLHANTLHLMMNGLTLWIFGSAVERAIGWWRLLVIFFVAGIAGNLLSALYGSYDVAVGASGGIFGLIGGFGVAVYRLRAPLYAALRRRLLLLLGLTVAVDFTVGAAEPHLDNLAHVGGFLAGLALALLLDTRARRGDAQMRGQRADRLL